MLTGLFHGADVLIGRLLGRGVPAVTTGYIVGQIVLVVLLAWSIGWIAIVLRGPLLKVGLPLLAVVEVLTGCWVASLYSVVVSPVPGVVAALVALVLGLIYSYSGAGRNDQTVQSFLGHRTVGTTLQEIQSMGGLRGLASEPREATVIVCEVVNTEELLGALAPDAFVAIHDDILSRLAEFFVRRGAILDACDAQGVRVLFLPTRKDATPAVTACEAALDALERVREWNGQAMERHERFLDCRMGLESGVAVPATLGTGSNRSLHFLTTAWLGARQMARANIGFGSAIVVSSRVYELAASNVEVRPLDFLQMSETRAPLEIFELLTRRGDFSTEDAARRDSFWKGVIYYREGRYSEALAMFRLAAGGRTPDSPLEYYLERARYALSTPESVEPEPIEEL